MGTTPWDSWSGRRADNRHGKLVWKYWKSEYVYEEHDIWELRNVKTTTWEEETDIDYYQFISEHPEHEWKPPVKPTKPPQKTSSRFPEDAPWYIEGVEAPSCRLTHKGWYKRRVRAINGCYCPYCVNKYDIDYRHEGIDPYEDIKDQEWQLEPYGYNK